MKLNGQDKIDAYGISFLSLKARQLQQKKRKNNYRIKGCNPVLEIEHILALQPICHFSSIRQTIRILSDPNSHAMK